MAQVATTLAPQTTQAALPAGERPGQRVELRGLEPLTPTLPVWCATSCATAPWCRPVWCVRAVENNTGPRTAPGEGVPTGRRVAMGQPADGGGVSWATRTELPNGSRNPKSMP